MPDRETETKNKKEKKKKSKKRSQTEETKAEADKANERKTLQKEKDDSCHSQEDDSDDDDDDDDDEIQAMAAAWARDGEPLKADQDASRESPPDKANATADAEAPPADIAPKTKKQQKRKKSTNESTKPSDSKHAKADPPSSYSLHISQLPFDVTEWELRQWFVEHAGVMFQQVRMVYDAGDDETGKPVFRGVAFGECATQAQYDAALKLHQSHQHKLKGRRINVRPTRTKAELASIVQERNELVQTKLQSLLQKRKQPDGSATKDDDKKKSHKKAKQQKPSKSSPTKKSNNPKAAATSSSPSVNRDAHKTKSPHKLTKKERNRRAAILMSKKRAAKK